MTEPRRPDPDALLALVQSEAGERRDRARGRLKVFLGATAGVGKTYAMLQSAQERRRAGIDVVVGLVETHGRKETEAQLAGLELLPRLRLAHGGVTLEELDVDAALARRPALLLVDELAHTNAPGARHAKRWQDVEELLGAGIDVHTTLNVQHLESLVDVVARVTGVTVRETVPDALLDAADEVALVDLPPEELLARLRAGKVYLPAQAERALERFFRPANLVALRQLALLRTADRVDRQMELHRRAQGGDASWPVRDRLLVGVGPAPSSERLVRATKRMADRLGAEWTAIFVETPASSSWPERDRARVHEALALAERLGGRAVTLGGDDAAREMLAWARAHNVTRLVVGKPTHASWRDRIGLSFHDRVVRGSGAIDVYVITGDAKERTGRARDGAPAALGRAPRAYLEAALAVAATTGVAMLLEPAFERTNLAMLYLVTVVLVALRGGRGASALAAVLGVAAFDFFFVPPRLTFAVSDSQYLFSFVVMLAVGLLVGGLTARLRDGREAARRREWRTAFLYEVSRELADADDVDAMLALVVPRVATMLGARVDALLPDTSRTLRTWRAADGEPLDDPAARAVAGWVHANRTPAGAGTETFASRPDLFLPLTAGGPSHGVLWVHTAEGAAGPDPDRRPLLDAVVTLLAGAMERRRLAQAARLALAPAPTSLAPLVAEALAELAPHAAAGGVSLESDVDDALPTVLADAGRVRAVLVALVERALDAPGPRRRVAVSAEPVGGVVQLEVADDGPSLTLEAQARAFDEPAGHGAALALARDVVRAHGGTMWVDGGTGSGVVFAFTLPVAS